MYVFVTHRFEEEQNSGHVEHGQKSITFALNCVQHAPTPTPLLLRCYTNITAGLLLVCKTLAPQRSCV